MFAAAKRTAVVALFATLIVVLSLAQAAGAARRDKRPPSTPTSLRILSVTPSTVSLAWNPSTDNVGVAGYGVYVNGVRKQSVSQPSATVSDLTCGTAFTMAVDAYDTAGNRSRRAAVTVSTAACLDTQAPSTPTGFVQQSTSEDAVVLAWSPSIDNVGVVSYGVYRNGVLSQSTAQPVATVSGLTCGSVYQVNVDAADAAGNRSQQGSAWVRTSACADREPPATPAGLAVSARTATSLTLNWSPSSDNVGVVSYSLYRNGASVGRATSTSYVFSGLACNTSYALAVDASDAAGNRSPQAQISASTTACPSAAVLYVSTTGNDTSTCTASSPCRSFNRAYQVAQPGATIEVAAGSYPDQLVQSDGRAASSAYAVFRPAAGAQVSLSRLETGASRVEYRDMAVTNYVLRGPGDGVVLRNVDANTFSMAGGQNISVIGGDVGPSVNSQPNVGKTNVENPPSNLVIDGVNFHDHNHTAGMHTECLQIGGVQGMVIRASTFRNCAGTADIHVGRYDEAWPSRNVTIEDNFFYDNSGASSQPLGNIQYSRAEPGLVVRFNTFVGSGGYSLLTYNESRAPASPGAQIYGNLANQPGHSQPDGYGPCDSNASYHNNVWRGASCSSSDLNVSSIGVVSLSSDLHLRADSPAVGRGGTGYPALDIDGEARPAGGAADAGADEVASDSSSLTSDSTPPSTPTGLAVSSATATSVSLAWNASTDNTGVAGYGIYLNGASKQTTTQPGSTISGLSCGTAYTFEVEAYDAAGNRSGRASVVGTTSPCADAQPPTLPSNLLVTSRTATSVALSWTPSTDNVGVVGYGLYRGTTLIGTTASSAAIFSGLACGSTYTLSIDAYDAAGNRSQTASLTAATLACADTVPPSTPTGLAASSVGQTSLTLNWNPSTDNVGVTGYDVYRNGTKMASVTSTSAGQTGLTCGTSYDFGVVAYDAAGNRSPQAQLTTSSAACSSSSGSSGAALAVSTTGSDSNSCTQAAPCLSFNRAYQKAQCGDVIEVAPGSYGKQTLTEVSALSTCTSDVVFRPASTATVSDFYFGSGTGYSTDAPDHITIRGFRVPQGFTAHGDADYITLDQIDGGVFSLWGVQHWVIKNSDWGPCWSSGVNAASNCNAMFGHNNHSIETASGYGDPRPMDDILFEGNVVHDFILRTLGDHYECWRSDGDQPTTRLVVRGNRFYNCQIAAVTGTRIGDGSIFENNWVGATEPTYGCDTICLGAPRWLGFTTASNMSGTIIYRNNSSAPGTAALGSEGSFPPAGVVQAYGNIFGNSQCIPGVSYRDNIWIGSGACGSHAGSVATAPYVNPARDGSGDYHLLGPSLADAFVPTGCAALDYDDQFRPAACDAGSDEH